MNKEKKRLINRSKERFLDLLILPKIGSIRQSSVDRVFSEKNIDNLIYVKTNENLLSMNELPAINQSRNNSMEMKNKQDTLQKSIADRISKLENIKRKYKKKVENSLPEIALHIEKEEEYNFN